MNIFGTGSTRLLYRATGFASGITVTAYFWNPSLEQSELQTFTELEDDGVCLYYLDYNFTPVGVHLGKFYEDGAAKLSHSFRILNSVNAEVVDALNVDTYAEPGQEAPAATTTLVGKIGYIYKFLRNKVTNDGTNIKVYNDAGAVVDQKNTVGESEGTVTRGKFGTGP